MEGHVFYAVSRSRKTAVLYGLLLICLVAVLLMLHSKKPLVKRNAANHINSKSEERNPPTTEDPNVIMKRKSHLNAPSTQNRRLEAIETVCEKYKGIHPLYQPRPLKIATTHFFAEEMRKFSYCFITKAANTNMKRALFLSRGDVTSEQFEKSAKEHKRWDLRNPSMFVQAQDFRRLYNFTQLGLDLKEEKIQERLDAYFTFTLVRNPWVRLLSAYRDTYEFDKPSQTPPALYSKHGRLAIKYFREKATRQDIESGRSVTFLELLKYIVYQYAFNEPFDIHWEPAYSMCNPCEIKFDFIANFETLYEDARYILNKIGGKGNGLKEFPSPELSPSSIRSNKSTCGLLSEYYSKIPQDILDMVYEVYRYDFELFDYPKEIPTAEKCR